MSLSHGSPVAAVCSLEDEKDLVTPCTAGRVLHLTSSPVPGGGMQTHHITRLLPGSTEPNGLEVQPCSCIIYC